jgi:cell wall-associated NlpC family hydrolase
LTTEKEIRDAIIAEAKTWIGTKWHHEARVKGAGVDCGMLLIEVFHAVGLMPKVMPEHYAPDFMLHRNEEWFTDIIRLYADEIPESYGLLPGDVVVFRNGRTYSHGGIIADYPRIIHASRPDGCVCYGDMSRFPLCKRRRKLFRYKFVGTE